MHQYPDVQARLRFGTPFQVSVGDETGDTRHAHAQGAGPPPEVTVQNGASNQQVWPRRLGDPSAVCVASKLTDPGLGPPVDGDVVLGDAPAKYRPAVAAYAAKVRESS